jgi:hypothetical protein
MSRMRISGILFTALFELPADRLFSLQRNPVFPFENTAFAPNYSSGIRLRSSGSRILS